MGVSETSFNRAKVNYIARKRTKEKQHMQGRIADTIDSKKARQIKLFNRKQLKKQEKKNKKDAKMDTKWL